MKCLAFVILQLCPLVQLLHSEDFFADLLDDVLLFFDDSDEQLYHRPDLFRERPLEEEKRPLLNEEKPFYVNTVGRGMKPIRRILREKSPPLPNANKSFLRSEAVSRALLNDETRGGNSIAQGLTVVKPASHFQPKREDVERMQKYCNEERKKWLRVCMEDSVAVLRVPLHDVIQKKEKKSGKTKRKQKKKRKRKKKKNRAKQKKNRKLEQEDEQEKNKNKLSLEVFIR